MPGNQATRLPGDQAARQLGSQAALQQRSYYGQPAASFFVAARGGRSQALSATSPPRLSGVSTSSPHAANRPMN